MATSAKRRLFDPSTSPGGEVEEIDSLERGLLSEGPDSSYRRNDDAEEDDVLHWASFEGMEESFIKYETAKWLLYSLLLSLAWGIGLFMLLYLPIRRYILRRDIRSRSLYLTSHAIVYKVTRPVPFPCFGVLQKEKHVILPSVSDIVIEQGYLQSLFGVYSVRIENVGVRRPPSDDVQIQGLANPIAFRKAVLAQLSAMRNEVVARQASRMEDTPYWKLGLSAAMSPSRSPRPNLFPNSGELILLQKLEEVGNSVKRVHTLIEGLQSEKI